MRIYDTPDGEVLDEGEAETPATEQKSQREGQLSLTELLDRIEQRARPKERNLGHGIVQITPGDPSDVPALVKALRWYRERFQFELEIIVPDSPTKQGGIKQLMFETDASLAELLSEPADSVPKTSPTRPSPINPKS